MPAILGSKVQSAVCKALETDGVREHKENTAKYIGKTIRKLTKYKSAEVHLFGSTVTGLAVTGSDIDLAVDLAGDRKELSHKEQVAAVKELAEALDSFQARSLAETRAPIVSMKVLERDVDLCPRLLGVKKTDIIRSYAAHANTRVLFTALQMWGKKAGVISTHNLSTLGLTLMCLHYLRSTGAVVAPLGTDSQLPPPSSANPTFISNHLLGFFTFYTNGRQFNWETDVVSIRGSRKAKDLRWDPKEKAYLPLIEDPVLDENVCHMEAKACSKVRIAFEETRKKLETGVFDM